MWCTFTYFYLNSAPSGYSFARKRPRLFADKRGLFECGDASLKCELICAIMTLKR